MPPGYCKQARICLLASKGVSATAVFGSSKRLHLALSAKICAGCSTGGFFLPRRLVLLVSVCRLAGQLLLKAVCRHLPQGPFVCLLALCFCLGRRHLC